MKNQIRPPLCQFRTAIIMSTSVNHMNMIKSFHTITAGETFLIVLVRPKVEEFLTLTQYYVCSQKSQITSEGFKPILFIF